MPTAFRHGPYRFHFYAGDRNEPPHIHVRRDDCEAKYWLDPVLLADSVGFASHELRQIRDLINEHRDALLEQWNEYFG
jgi:hypothetical protein